MKTILAANLQVGSIIDKVEGNPNVRGTVMQVNRFGNTVSANVPSRRPVGGWDAKGKEFRPAPLIEARLIAQEVEDCYQESGPTSIAIKIGARNITLAADAKVTVWVPAKEAVDAFYGKM